MSAAVTEPSAPTSPGTRALQTLTDEELVVLCPTPGSGSVVVTPYLDTLADDEREVAVRTAFRSLVSRGVIDRLPDADATTGDQPAGSADRSEALVREDVLAPMTLRSAARTLVAVARTTAGGQDYWYAHLVSDVVLLEEVTDDGQHRFALGRSADLPDLLVAAVIHPDAVAGSGEEVTVPAAEPGSVEPVVPPGLVERLGEAHVRADVVVLVADDRADDRPDAPTRSRPDLTGVFTGPTGSWTLTARPGHGVVAAPTEVDALEKQVRALGTEAVTAAARQAGGAGS